jgi:hypothetical protein
MTKLMGEINGSFKHGARRKGEKTSPEYDAWRNMKKRCLDPNIPDFHLWGGRGIRVCDEWINSFEAFLLAVGPRPSIRYSLDRFPDPDGHYEPGNVRWATKPEQRHNSKAAKLDWEKAKLIRERLAAGESQQSIADLFGVSQRNISQIKLGRIWTTEF